jgi:hypothetical protein
LSRLAENAALDKSRFIAYFEVEQEGLCAFLGDEGLKRIDGDDAAEDSPVVHPHVKTADLSVLAVGLALLASD